MLLTCVNSSIGFQHGPTHVQLDMLQASVRPKQQSFRYLNLAVVRVSRIQITLQQSFRYPNLATVFQVTKPSSSFLGIQTLQQSNSFTYPNLAAVFQVSKPYRQQLRRRSSSSPNHWLQAVLYTKNTHYSVVAFRRRPIFWISYSIQTSAIETDIYNTSVKLFCCITYIMHLFLLTSTHRNLAKDASTCTRAQRQWWGEPYYFERDSTHFWPRGGQTDVTSPTWRHRATTWNGSGSMWRPVQRVNVTSPCNGSTTRVLGLR